MRRLGVVLAVFLWGTVLNAAVAPGQIIGTKRGKVYHTHPNQCTAARRIQADNKVVFASAAEAEAAGRRLCKRCAELDRKAAERKKKRAEPPPESDAPEPRGRTKPDDAPPEKSPPAKGDVGHAAELPRIVSVKDVLVGGTLEFDNGEKAALLGVVAPLWGQPCDSEAVRFIEEQTRGRQLRVLGESALFRRRSRDPLGRTLVYAQPCPGGRDLAGELIFQGYGWLDRSNDFARFAEYMRLEEEAWRSGRGVWKRLKGKAGERKVITGRHADHYHPPDCPHVKHLTGVMEMTLNEAIGRRLTPCSEFREKTKTRGKSRGDGRGKERKRRGDKAD